MKTKHFNTAQRLLCAIGGLAGLVAGLGGHYYADHQTPKKQPKRSRVGRGGYGKGLQSHFDTQRRQS